ncbi:TATA box-binding protein-like 2, partial [Oppia nitens]|uniref:TATA box-binding protein-like 2 n=1 Tax=Oppia nitens TaxID=1686743 RepID=UPI0023D98BD2
MPVITNVSMTADLFDMIGFIDLRKLCNNCCNCVYHNYPFVRVIKRYRNPNATVMIYDSGKLVCVGAKSKNDGRIALRKTARIIQKLGYDIKLHNLRVTNIAASHNLKNDLNVEKLMNQFNWSSNYELEIFPHLRINCGHMISAIPSPLIHRKVDQF